MSPLAGALLAVVFWGVSFVATKAVVREISPFALILLRTALGSALMLAVLAARRAPAAPAVLADAGAHGLRGRRTPSAPPGLRAHVHVRGEHRLADRPHARLVGPARARAAARAVLLAEGARPGHRLPRCGRGR